MPAPPTPAGACPHELGYPWHPLQVITPLTEFPLSNTLPPNQPITIMNNYHLFLIRSSCVTQLAAHLAAGILALILFSGMTAPRSPRVPDAVRPVHVARGMMPAGTAVLAATERVSQ